MRGRGKSSASHSCSVCAAPPAPPLGSRLAPGCTRHVQAGVASHLRAAARASEDAREVHVFWGPPCNPPPPPKPDSFRVAELPEGSEL